MPSLWIRTPLDPPPHSGRERKISGGQLLDLVGLQQLICDGSLIEDDVQAVTTRCGIDLENYRWFFDDVLQMISLLTTSDYQGSWWCKTSRGRFVACDAYRLRYDSDQRTRHRQGLEVYLKFSIDESRRLSLVLVSCHGSR